MARGRVCRLTVLACDYNEGLAKRYAPSACGPCERFHEGQEFLLDQNGPTGWWHLMGGTFCSEAWDVVGKYADTILQGGTFEAGGEPGNYRICCCPNAIRPVTFKVELAGVPSPCEGVNPYA